MLPDLLQHPGIWQASHRHRPRAVVASGHPALDHCLADGGLPRGALTELLVARLHQGELDLLLPLLAARAGANDRIVLVDPPYAPCLAGWRQAGIRAEQLLWLLPPDLPQWLWCIDQATRTASCTVLAWTGRHRLATRDLRRLQLAAQTGDNLLLLMRRDDAAQQASPAALRLQLRQGGAPRHAIQVRVLKQRGGFSGAAVQLQLRDLPPRLPAARLPVHLPAAQGNEEQAPMTAPPWPTAHWHDTQRETVAPLH